MHNTPHVECVTEIIRRRSDRFGLHFCGRERSAILDVEQPGYFLPTMHSAPRQPSRRVKQTTALHCQRLRIAFISPLFTLSYAKLFFIVCCTNNSVNGDDLAFFRIPNEASERERRGI